MWPLFLLDMVLLHATFRSRSAQREQANLTMGCESVAGDFSLVGSRSIEAAGRQWAQSRHLSTFALDTSKVTIRSRSDPYGSRRDEQLWSASPRPLLSQPMKPGDHFATRPCALTDRWAVARLLFPSRLRKRVVSQEMTDSIDNAPNPPRLWSVGPMTLPRFPHFSSALSVSFLAGRAATRSDCPLVGERHLHRLSGSVPCVLALRNVSRAECRC
jgi:hypothetical protein